MEKKTLGQKLVLYGIGAGAASLALPADADIVWSGPVEFSANQIFFDLQNVSPPSTVFDPNHDFNLQSKVTKGSKAANYSAGVNSGYTMGDIRGPGRRYAFQLPAGAVIGSGGTFLGYAYLQNYYAGGPYTGPGLGLGDWMPGDRGFLGLRLVVGADTFFGWADVTLNNLDGSAPGVFTLHSYAYEDVAGTSILTGAVPEPSAIALLVAGAAGVLALKRRKK
jgi:hypothetical protein